jgi:hypothetical protein
MIGRHFSALGSRGGVPRAMTWNLRSGTVSTRAESIPNRRQITNRLGKTQSLSQAQDGNQIGKARAKNDQ